MRVYDCFTFFNELDLLEIRLAELFDVIDTFVIAEATVTFQGKKKPLYFRENRERFAKYEGKIRHIIIDDMPETENPWQREHHQRNALKRGLQDAETDSLVLISDVDEIFRREAITKLKSRNAFCFVAMTPYAFFLNCEAVSGLYIPWIKAYGAPWHAIRDIPDLTKPREGDPQKEPQNYLRSQGIDDYASHLISNGGWHFSWLGDPDRILTKLDSFSHTEPQFQKWKDRDFIARAIAKRKFFPSGAKMAVKPVDTSFPSLIQERKDAYMEKGLVAQVEEKRSIFTRLLKRSA